MKLVKKKQSCFIFFLDFLIINFCFFWRLDNIWDKYGLIVTTFKLQADKSKKSYICFYFKKWFI